MSQASIPRWINFDQYQRYHFIERVLNAFANGRQLKILEVGGAFSSALHYLSPNHAIWVVDTIPAPDIHLRTSAMNLPFMAKSFDCVVCTDVLEHVPEKDRKRIIDELQRVTRGILILGFPRNSVESRVADELLSKWIRESSGHDYAFLSEHSSFGLPDAGEVRKILQTKGGSILEAGNANVHSWLPLMMSYFAIEKHAELAEAKKVLNKLFNEKYESASHTSPAYRIFFLWFPAPGHETTFQNVKQLLETPVEDVVHEFAWSSLILSLSFQRALRSFQQQSDEQINAARKELESVRGSSSELQAHLKSLDREIVLLQDQRRELISKLDSAGEELRQRAQRMKEQDKKIESLIELGEKRRQTIEAREHEIRTLIQEHKSEIAEVNRRHEQHMVGVIQEHQNQTTGLTQRHNHVIAGLKQQLYDTKEYLNLFLNHPVYRLYKFFKGNRGPGQQFASVSSDALAADNADDTEFLFDQADRLFSSGDLEGAGQIYRAVHHRQKHNERAALSLVRVMQAHGNFSEANHVLKESLKHNPTSLTFLSLLASIALSTGSFWEAERLYRKIIIASPSNVEALLGLADLAVGDAKYEDAFLAYKHVLESEPQNLAALSGLAECSKHLSAAKIHSDELRKLYPQDSLIANILRQEETSTHRPLVSIIIPVFNQLNYTRQCIDEIRRNTCNPYELILVNNGSSDGTMEYLESLRSDRVKIQHNRDNTGFVQACNQGAELAAAEYLLFLNNDTLPRAGWLEALLDTIQNVPGVGAVGAKLLYPDGVLQEAGSIVFSDASAWNYGKGEDPESPEYNYVRETPYCSAACLLIRRNLFKDIGGFDSRYSPAYWEDADLAFEIRKRGLKVVYQPRAEVVHFEGITGGTSLHSGYKQYQVRNQGIFRQKWIEELKDQQPLNRDKLKSASIQNSNDRILVVDHYLPVFDRNSGNHRAYQFMRLIRKAEHPITFVARNGEYQARYKQELQNIGIETYATDRDHLEAESYTPSARKIRWNDLLNEGDYQLAILSRYQNARIYLPLIRTHSPETKIVLDTVDVHFLREQRMATLYGAMHLHENASETRKSELEVCRKADALIAVTEEDATVLRKELGNEKPVWVIPNIHPVEKTPVPFSQRSGLVFVGNFVHPPNSDAMYYFCGQILPLIQKELPDIYLYIVGGNSLPWLEKLRTDRTILTGYVPSTKPFLDHCRLSINPLRYGAGMKGKIGEAMSRGLPVVTTAIGAEGFSFQIGTHALVADSTQEFARAVIEAYSNETLWNKLSENGRRLIEERYSPDAVFPTVRSLLNWD